jgi:hypothetical protein
MPTPASLSIGRRRPGDARRFLPVALVPLVILPVALATVSADPPAHVVHLSRADAARAGALLRLAPHVAAGATMVEVLPDASLAARAAPPPALLAVSADAGQAALADRVGELWGTLTIAHADGSQLQVQLPGLLAAGFSADGGSLAVVDGRGALWHVDAASGSSSLLADGPFLGSPVSLADGSLMLLAVSSVEAPYRSQLVRVSASDGAVTAISDDELVYAGFLLADGSLALVAHQPGSTLVRRLADGETASLADLEPGAVNVAVAPDGQRVAYEIAGRGIFVLGRPGAGPVSIGDGSRPCFASNSSTIAVERGSGSVLLTLDGAIVLETDQPAMLAGSAGCRP